MSKKLGLFLLIVLPLGVLLGGCGSTSSYVDASSKVQESFAPTEEFKTEFRNGVIISNHAILVEDYGTGSLTPGVIVKLDTGEVVFIKLINSTPQELKNYSYVYGENVRCKTGSSRWRIRLDDRWNLVPLDK